MKPLSVALSALIKNNKILLIKRIRGDYIGLLSLPGGKIELNEHLSNASVREIKEESGIKSRFKKHLAVVSEHLIENNQILNHFLLHICELEPETTEITANNEGNLEWFDLNQIKNMKDKIIPSDYLIIQKIILNKEKNYYDCIIEKIKDKHFLRKFE